MRRLIKLHIKQQVHSLVSSIETLAIAFLPEATYLLSSLPLILFELCRKEGERDSQRDVDKSEGKHQLNEISTNKL